MSSRNKRKVARQNGAKAAGTKSPAGIAKSSLNATKHGLTGKAIVLSNENERLFDELHLEYVHEFQPASTVEMDLIDQMVAAQWRLRRIWRMQTAAIDHKMDEQDPEIAKKYRTIDQCTRSLVAVAALANEEHTLDLLLRYETTYTRMHQRAMNSLFKLRKEKLQNDPTSTEELLPEPPEETLEPRREPSKSAEPTPTSGKTECQPPDPTSMDLSKEPERMPDPSE